MDDETGHAHDLIRRILMLGGTPASAPTSVHIGTDAVEMLKIDLKLELDVQAHLKKGIALCEKHQDYVTRQMLVEQLKDTEEDHAHWLEQQLNLIDKMDPKNYLQSHV
ncbi:Bacterioferritin [Oligella sp. MSHR50489EDL]